MHTAAEKCCGFSGFFHLSTSFLKLGLYHTSYNKMEIARDFMEEFLFVAIHFSNWIIFPEIRPNFFCISKKPTVLQDDGNWDILCLWFLSQILPSGKWEPLGIQWIPRGQCGDGRRTGLLHTVSLVIASADIVPPLQSWPSMIRAFFTGGGRRLQPLMSWVIRTMGAALPATVPARMFITSTPDLSVQVAGGLHRLRS